MDRRDVRKLLRSRFVLFSCEGTAEGAVMQRLYDEDALVVPRERVVVDPMMFTPYTRQRKADSIARTFFANSYEGYGASGLLIARIVDSRAGRFVLPRRWNKNVAVESFFTRPEIEMLVSRKRGCARMRVAKLNGPSSMVLPSCGPFSAEVGRPWPLSACKGEAP
jgi:hypothetical protein